MKVAMGGIMVHSEKFNLFKGAEEMWDLPRLYRDLGRAKRQVAPQARQGLSDTERQDLRGLLCGYSPAEVAGQTCRQSRTVEVRLCQRLYRYVEVLTERSRNSLKYWWHVKEWLEEAGYKMQAQVKAKGERFGDVAELAQSNATLSENRNRGWMESVTETNQWTISGWFKGKLQAEFARFSRFEMPALSENQWHLVGMTWVGHPAGRVQFYLDGNLVREEMYPYGSDDGRPLLNLFSSLSRNDKRMPDRQEEAKLGDMEIERSNLSLECSSIEMQDLRLYRRVLAAQDFRRMMTGNEG